MHNGIGSVLLRGSTGAGQTASPADKVPQAETVLEAQSHRLNVLRERMALQADRLERVLTRALGENVPTEGASCKPQGITSGVVGAISQHMSDLEDVASKFEAIANRFDQIV